MLLGVSNQRSRWERARRRIAIVALVAVAALAAVGTPSPAAAASRVETIDLPSTQGNIDLRLARLNQATALRARVLLPDGYDEHPDARWPVFYLLHGVGDTSATWLDYRHGDARVRAAGFPGIIVMPEGGRGYYTDAWMSGQRIGVNWERYELDEVVPAIEARYRIAPGRQNHVIGGLSMGGYGSVLLAAELPSYFGTAISMSGLLAIEQRPAELLVPFFSSFSYLRTWGPFRGPYAQAHDPVKLLGNLAKTRFFLSVGNGVPDWQLPLDPGGIVLGGPAEVAARLDAQRFAGLLRARGIPFTYDSHVGIHGWPYWRRELQRVIAWGPIDPADPPPAADPLNFTYTSMAPHGNAWGLGFRFAALPTALLTLERSGQHLSAAGTGTLTISPGAADADASGNGTKPQCTFTATLPFERDLPAGC